METDVYLLGSVGELIIAQLYTLFLVQLNKIICRGGNITQLCMVDIIIVLG